MNEHRTSGPDDQLRALASRQLGLVTRRQATDLGLGPRAMAKGRRRAEWLPVTGRVLRAASAPDHVLTRAMVALLHVGRDAALGGQTAAAFWGLPGFRLEPVEVVRSRGGTSSPNRWCRVRTSTAFGDGHVAEVDGMRVTTPLRTVFDLSAELHPLRTARLLDTCHNRGLVTWSSLHRIVRELGGSGRRGTTLMRELADERPEGFRPPESNLEARVNDVLVRSGQRPLTPQVDLGDTEWIGRVDLVDRDDRIALEVQSGIWHGSLTDGRRDAERVRRLRAAGWVVVEVDEFVVWHRPDELVERVRAARAASRRHRFEAA